MDILISTVFVLNSRCLILEKAGKIIYNFGDEIIKGILMQAYELTQLITQRTDSNKAYLEFLKVPDLSMGLYTLPAGGVDLQSPHTEDEVYYVVSGKAKVQVADENRDVQAGAIVYVAKSIEHRFHSIEEELTVIVFFAPAEYSNKS